MYAMIPASSPSLSSSEADLVLSIIANTMIVGVLNHLLCRNWDLYESGVVYGFMDMCA